MSTFNSRTPTQVSNIVSQHHSQPRLYISRNNGTFVPLVPADELPFNIRLQGVPRVLNSDQVFGLQHVAMLPYTGSTFKLENDIVRQRLSGQSLAAAHIRSRSSTESQNWRQPDVSACKDPQNWSIGSPVANTPLSVPAYDTNWRKSPTSDPQAVIDAIVRTKVGSKAATQMGYIPKSQDILPPSGSIPDKEKKLYCTHWIRCGECDYTQQGCLYKHEMPDKATLLKIGFRSTPMWWLEKTQPVKFGGTRAAAGPLLKSSEWLRPADAESSDHDSSDSEISSPEGREVKWTSKHRGLETKTTDTDANANDNSDRTDACPPVQSALAGTEERKQSTTSDLIDFEPLLPTPSSSISSCSATHLSIEPEQNAKLPNNMLQTTSQIHTKPENFQKKIFVRVGERQELHIAEIKTKAARKQSCATANTSKKNRCRSRSKLNNDRERSARIV